MKTNIALIGFMGTGKTAVGRALAKRLGREFVEMDSLIEQKAGKSIAEIFQQDGEIAFREVEIEVAREVAKGKNLVVACGGGVVLNKINIDRLKEGAKVVYLVASLQVILKRVLKGGEVRPLMNVSDRAATIRELLRFRKPFYERAADITINASKLDIESVAEQIIGRLKQDESFNLWE